MDFRAAGELRRNLPGEGTRANVPKSRPYAQHLEFTEHLPTWTDVRDRVFHEATAIGRGLLPNALTPVQRTILAPSKPKEELCDTLAAPHATRHWRMTRCSPGISLDSVRRCTGDKRSTVSSAYPRIDARRALAAGRRVAGDGSAVWSPASDSYSGRATTRRLPLGVRDAREVASRIAGMKRGGLG